ncbi:MAG: class I SAM-dependent methyltransferase [Colwellia sp.]
MINFISATNFTDAQRLFHGRGHAYDGLSHVNVDWLSPVILITLYQAVDEQWLIAQAHTLKALIPDCTSVQVQCRYEKFAPTRLLIGDSVERTQVNENGLRYHIEFGKAQNTGLFLDMSKGREWVKSHVNNKNVLNLFSYTCAFSVVAVEGGASKVVNLDLSKASLNKGRENHRLNHHLDKQLGNKLGNQLGNQLDKPQASHQVVFEGMDIFKSNSRIKRHGKYDLLICDPPSFQKGSVDIKRDYAKIIRKIPQWMNNGAKLMLCLNSPDLDEQFLKDEVARFCPECVFEQRIANPDVFKEAHQGKGLKTLVFTYLPEPQ